MAYLFFNLNESAPLISTGVWADEAVSVEYTGYEEIQILCYDCSRHLFKKKLLHRMSEEKEYCFYDICSDCITVCCKDADEALTFFSKYKIDLKKMEKICIGSYYASSFTLKDSLDNISIRFDLISFPNLPFNCYLMCELSPETVFSKAILEFLINVISGFMSSRQSCVLQENFSDIPGNETGDCNVNLLCSENTFDSVIDVIENYFSRSLIIAYDVISAGDDDLLHDFRVFTRRAMAVISVFLKIKNNENFCELKRILKNMLRISGNLRDLQVLQNKLKQTNSDVSVGETEILLDYLHGEIQEELESFKTFIKGTDFLKDMFRFFSIIRKIRNSKYGKKIGKKDLLKNLMSVSKEKVKSSQKALKNAFTDKNIHSLRKSFKAFRYISEMISVIDKKGSANIEVKNARKMQQKLGRYNDCVVQLKKLMEIQKSSFCADSQTGKSVSGLIDIVSQEKKIMADELMKGKVF